MTGHREEIGRKLREARQSAGLSLTEISEAIRVRPVYLTAIEAGEFERLPALPQTVGFTRAYARHLSVDIDKPLSALGEEVHRHIDSADYSDPEPVWTVSPRRAGYVSAGALLGVLLLGLFLIDFSEDRPVPAIEATARGPAISAPAAVERQPVRPATPQIESAGMPAKPALALPSAPVSAALLLQIEALLATQAKALSVNELPASPQAAPASDARYVTSDVYLRAEPANTGAVVGVLTGCETVFLEKADERGRWLHVGRGDGSSGWVFRAYISAAKPAPCR
ncbi:MAG: helix-turn-helix domain-containing protein [Parvibaculum sp.]|nr:helix-turn-helix domain-containing protein [Parvibaculum sp.]